MLMLGYGTFVGPGNYTQSIGDAVAHPANHRKFSYLGEILRVGEELKETIFLGRFLDTLQVNVQVGEAVKFRVHQNAETGRRACVLMSDASTAQQATVAFEGNADGPCLVYRPFEKPEPARLPVELSIPSERVVVVLEDDDR